MCLGVPAYSTIVGSCRISESISVSFADPDALRTFSWGGAKAIRGSAWSRALRWEMYLEAYLSSSLHWPATNPPESSDGLRYHCTTATCILTSDTDICMVFDMMKRAISGLRGNLGAAERRVLMKGLKPEHLKPRSQARDSSTARGGGEIEDGILHILPRRSHSISPSTLRKSLPVVGEAVCQARSDLIKDRGVRSVGLQMNSNCCLSRSVAYNLRKSEDLQTMIEGNLFRDQVRDPNLTYPRALGIQSASGASENRLVGCLPRGGRCGHISLGFIASMIDRGRKGPMKGRARDEPKSGEVHSPSILRRRSSIPSLAPTWGTCHATDVRSILLGIMAFCLELLSGIHLGKMGPPQR
ncbi:hypothetical protein B0H10DRAFT_1939504 [Mycena sp. CBHHK59/15]|nr:hypothetical protein B0H10DRAFT_1939504 [Mycena sp. CBHHK59/15]